MAKGSPSVPFTKSISPLDNKLARPVGFVDKNADSRIKDKGKEAEEEPRKGKTDEDEDKGKRGKTCEGFDHDDDEELSRAPPGQGRRGRRLACPLG